MGRVAERLGFTTMSLYRYVASKDDLLALMFDAAMDPVPTRGRRRGWRRGLHRWAHELMASYRRHPWALDIPITGPPALPNQLAWLDWGLAELEGTGLGAAERLSVMLLLSGYVRNVAQLTRDITSSTPAPARPPPRSASSTRRCSSSSSPRDRFPHLHAAVFAGLLTDGSAEDDLEFEFGLQRVLDGIEALVERRRS